MASTSWTETGSFGIGIVAPKGLMDLTNKREVIGTACRDKLSFDGCAV
jgi:hypothetical protein